MIQDINHVHTKFKLLGLGDSHTLDEIRIESEMCRPFNPPEAQTTDLSRRGIHKESIAFLIRNCLVAELAVQSLKRRDISGRWIRDLLQPGKIRNAVRKFCDFPDALGKVRNHIRSVKGHGGSAYQVLPDRRYR